LGPPHISYSHHLEMNQQILRLRLSPQQKEQQQHIDELSNCSSDLLKAVRGEGSTPTPEELDPDRKDTRGVTDAGLAARTVKTTSRSLRLVSSQWFEGVCGACIIANAAAIAYAADHAASNIHNAETSQIIWQERGFTAFYVIELILRLMAHKCDFFRGPDWMWNVFDTVLVVSAIYDQMAPFTTASQGGNTNVIFLRIVRVMKMLKLLRMVRIMRMFKEPRLIVTSIRGSLKSMIWAVLLILIITYMVGLCFLQAGTTYLQENGENVSKKEFHAIRRYWGSVSKAMLSLYMASTNGDSWKDMAETLILPGYVFYILFLLYIAFFLFVVMNTLTSLFIEATIQNAEKDKHMMIREELERKSDYMKRAIELFKHMDQDGSGDISQQEFRTYANDPHMLAFASSLELQVSDIAQFYNMLSCRGKYKVDEETFVEGCLKLKGTARSLDLQGLIASQKRALRTLETLVGVCNDLVALTRNAVL